MYHKVAFWPQVRPELAKKVQNHPQKCHVPLCQGTRQVLHWQPTTLFSLNDPK